MSSSTFHIERLEARRLLAGITLITHGYQSDGVFPQWVDRMAEAVDKRIEPSSSSMWTDAAMYRMRATGSSSAVSISSFSRVSGPAPVSSRSGEAVIALDWASVSGLSGPSTAQVAQAVVTALMGAGASLGFSSAGAMALPIHLIGHSRGGSLVSEIGRLLGQQGTWVDQLTTLDAYPIGSDPAATVSDNVYYADNYFETSDFIVHGSSIAGAHNVGPLNLPGGSSLSHLDVHTYYHGSIDRGATGDGDVTLNPAWYGATTLNRATAGFDASRISGGTRATDGLSILGGGSAARVHVEPTIITPMPNFAITSLSGGSNGVINTGDSFTLNFRYQSHTTSSEIDVYLDNDQNMYNGFTRVFVIGPALPITGATPNTSARSASGNWSSFGLTPGVYYLNGVITDGLAGHQRIASLAQPILVTATGMQLITKRWADDTASHDWSEPRNWSPGGVPASTDRALLNFGATTLARDAGVRSLAITNGAALSASASQHIGAVALFDTAKLTLASNGNRILATKALSLGATADLDLNDNDLILDYDGTSQLPAIQSLISSASQGGAWTGHGLTSTAARTSAQGNTSLGAMEGSDYRNVNDVTFDGEPVDTTSVVVKYTYYGDVDFNGAVDSTDYNLIDFGFLTNASGWANGDVDFNGAVDSTDYNLIDFAFVSQGGVL